MVMAQTLFKVLKQRLATPEIHVIAPDWSQALLDRMPEVSRSMNMPLAHGELGVKKRRHLGKALRDELYDWSIVLPNSFKSAIVPFAAKIPRRTGWRGEMRFALINDMRQLDKRELPYMIQRFAALGYDVPYDQSELAFEKLPKPSLSVAEKDIQAGVDKFGLSLDRPVLVFCPGAEFGEAKCWPFEYYAIVANHFIKQGWQVWLMGSKKDEVVASQIATSVSPALRSALVTLAGKTALSEAIDLMSLAESVVTNDSGLMHVAAALNKSIVAIYGSTSPDFTPPLSEKADTLSLDLSCRPCFERTCPLVHLDCLRKLAPGRVIKALESQLSHLALPSSVS